MKEVEQPEFHFICQYCRGQKDHQSRTPKTVIEFKDQSNYHSPRITPELPVTDIDVDTLSCDANNDCPEDGLLSKSRSFTPIQDSNDESFHLDKALSESAKQYPDDFIDPVAYACRSIEERRQKSIEEGKVSRPLNSYMLYRKAYQQVARRVIRKDQQQSASQTVGTSWSKLERDEIKSKFRALAKIDHEKHLEAFPTYRYTPTQGKNSRGSSESKRSASAERRSVRRSGQRSIDTLPRPKRAFVPPSGDALLGDQCCNSGSDWWFRAQHDCGTLLPQTGNMYDGYEPYAVPNSTYFGVSVQNQPGEHSLGHLSRHLISTTPGSLEVFDFDNFIDPSLWSRFDGYNPQCSVPYMQWQGRNTATTGQHYMPETTLDHLTEVKSMKQEG
ncbi:hypothetical protein E4U43_008381 [Claviceps pusilla]|uniref:HMG box domain-containing protein n=1 Tax=Claviceps pusilla TaxID=123648 RepID=A0A9P7NH33_9HYPO|nr:hypothetical protein E4U43_008381 [Claviceps pusilla]